MPRSWQAAYPICSTPAPEPPSQPRVDGLRLQGEYGEDRLVHPPQRLAVHEPGQRLDPQPVLAQGESALLAEMALPEYVERVGVVGPVDDAQVLPAAHLDPRLRPGRQGRGPAGRLHDHAVAT